MNLSYLLIILIVILVICIVLKIINQNKNESFKGLVNRQIMYAPSANSDSEKPKQLNDSSNTSENPENPNDDVANQTVIDLNNLNNETNSNIETFLFLDTPFKSSLNYIIINIENLILKLFKTKSGYLITNKDVDKVYVPYKQKLQPVPFNPYMPISRIPKYVYMNVIPRMNSFYLRKGDYYYYPFNGGLYSWYQWNNYRNKKETRNLIQGLYDKIKHLEEKAFSRPPPPPPHPFKQIQQISSNVPSNSNSYPIITINNTNNSNKTQLEDQINKLPELDSGTSNIPSNSTLGTTNLISNPLTVNKNVKINDAPSEELDKNIKTYSEPEVKIPEPEPIQQEIPASESEIKTEQTQPEISTQQENDELKEIEDLIDSKPELETTEIEAPKETFWSKFGF